MGKKTKKLKSKRAADPTQEKKCPPISNDNKSETKSRFSADELLDKADEYLETFNYDMARRFCQRAVELDALNCRALEMSGLLFLQADKADLAIGCYRKAVELKPEIGHVKYMYLGQLSSGIEAVQFYLKGIELMNKKLAEVQASQVTNVLSKEEISEGGSTVAKDSVCDITPRDVSNAYCAVAEIFLTDACFEDDAEVRCKESLDRAIEADVANPESFHLLASYWLSKDDKTKASEAINRGISLWLPQLRSADQPDGATAVDPVQVCSVGFSARINCTKTLIELQDYEVASEILELLLDEDDEVVEVWYLLGWINFLLGEDFRTNSRHYLCKALELATKQKYEDQQMISHVDELLKELGPETNEDNQMDEDDCLSESDDEDKEKPKPENENESEAMQL